MVHRAISLCAVSFHGYSGRSMRAVSSSLKRCMWGPCATRRGAAVGLCQTHQRKCSIMFVVLPYGHLTTLFPSPRTAFSSPTSSLIHNLFKDAHTSTDGSDCVLLGAFRFAGGLLDDADFVCALDRQVAGPHAHAGHLTPCP